MDNEFCNALAANARSKLQKIVDQFLDQLSVKDDQQRNFQKIEEWIASHDCVRSVEASPDLIDTYPPIKQFTVSLHGNAQPITLGISLQKDRWRFHRK